MIRTVSQETEELTKILKMCEKYDVITESLDHCLNIQNEIASKIKTTILDSVNVDLSSPAGEIDQSCPDKNQVTLAERARYYRLEKLTEILASLVDMETKIAQWYKEKKQQSHTLVSKNTNNEIHSMSNKVTKVTDNLNGVWMQTNAAALDFDSISIFSQNIERKIYSFHNLLELLLTIVMETTASCQDLRNIVDAKLLEGIRSKFPEKYIVSVLDIVEETHRSNERDECRTELK